MLLCFTVVVPNRLLCNVTTFPNAMEIVRGCTPDYHKHLGQINYACSSNGGCVGGWLANAIIFKALNFTVDDFLLTLGEARAC